MSKFSHNIKQLTSLSLQIFQTETWRQAKPSIENLLKVIYVALLDRLYHIAEDTEGIHGGH